MYCVRKVRDDLWWVGGNDRRLAIFEGVYPIPRGVSYNAYLLLDEKTVLFDTVDYSVSRLFFENVAHVLNGRALDYLVVQHMEPDHSGTISELLLRYPGATVICNERIAQMLRQFRGGEALPNPIRLVSEGDVITTGSHQFTFLAAPMVHWPEVMVTYDLTTGTLFSADAFGTFGALNGALFADEVNFERDYLDEARRYYCNIVGKYGTQVQALLKKASTVEINMVCPLHGFVWRRGIGDFIDKYVHWATYTPEEEGVVIAYASIYGNTANAADLLATRLRERGVPVAMFDVSVTHASEVIAAAFRYSHLVFAAPTYNAGIFVAMEALLHDLVAHNLQNRTIALIENGSWAPTAGGHMRKLLSGLKNTSFVGETLRICSALTAAQLDSVEALAGAICETMPMCQPKAATPVGAVDADSLFKLSYGLFVLSAREDGRDNACIINTAAQITDSPRRITITVNKQNLTHDMIASTGLFNLSILSEEADFATFRRFGFVSGREADKFEGLPELRSANGLRYLDTGCNAILSGKVIQAVDCGTHTLFTAEVTEARTLSAAPSATYAYYFEHIKPKPQPASEDKKGFVCKICGYVYEGESLPADYICPLCKHGAEDFEPLK